jgi:hypothetical protein
MDGNRHRASDSWLKIGSTEKKMLESPVLPVG